MIRSRFRGEMRKRFAFLKRRIITLVVDLDGVVVVNAADDKLDKFRDGVKKAVDETLGDGKWVEPFVEAAYTAGNLRAHGDILPKTGKSATEAAIDKAKASRTLKTGEVGRGKLRSLFTRTAEYIKTAAQSVVSGVVGVVSKLLGKTANEVASAATAEVNKVLETRALPTANHEPVHAQAEGYLDMAGVLGATVVRNVAEFRTSGDAHVCKVCQALNGKKYTLEDAHGVIPVHVGCRCGWMVAPVDGA